MLTVIRKPKIFRVPLGVGVGGNNKTVFAVQVVTTVCKDGVFLLFYISLCEFVISADFIYLLIAFASGKHTFLLNIKSRWLCAKHSR